MILLDVNVLIAVHRDDHLVHADVRAWFDALMERGDDFGVPVTAWASFLRIVTNRRVFVVPTPASDAFAFMQAIRAQPGHVRAEPGDRHLALLRRLCEEADAVGDLVPDAVLAAITLENGAQLATLDRDFARFDSVATIRLTGEIV